MSADNYIYVRKRPDGRYGVSMRFDSAHYSDETDMDNLPFHDVWITSNSRGYFVGQETANTHYYDTYEEAMEQVGRIPESWVNDPPEDRYGIFDNPLEALVAAHATETECTIVEYGVSVSPVVLEDCGRD